MSVPPPFLQCGKQFITIDRDWRTGRRGILSKKLVDQFYHHALKARSFLVIAHFCHECPLFAAQA
jgi:hypothetical protein